MVIQGILPEIRRARLKTLLSGERSLPLRFLEAHNGLSAIIANCSSITQVNGERKQFDGIWISGLTESASRGLPDIELLGLQSRIAVVREVIQVTDKAILMDGDTGGTIDQLCFHLRDLETLGVSGLIIEDKVFPKNNSLDFNKQQVLEQPDVFAEKIRQGKSALRTRDFMLIARIEALVAGRSVSESLLRARHYLLAGADAIVIHSRAKNAEEVIAFAKGYDDLTQTIKIKRPLIAIPTLYNSTNETELHAAGFDLVIYANYLLRSAYLAMKETAAQILLNGRSLEVENKCVSLGELFTLFEKS